MKSLCKCLKYITTEKMTSYLLPTIQSLYEDGSAHFKADLAIALCEMAQYVGKDMTMQKLMAILLDLIKDEDCDVRLNCSYGLIKLADVVGADLLSDSVLTALSQLTKDTQWRVRQSIFHLVSNLGIKFGKETFRDDLSSILFTFLVDTAAEVRSSVIEKVQELSESFGADWTIQTVVPKLNEVYDQEKQGYLYRMSVLKTAIAMAKNLNKNQVTTHLIPILQKGTKDDIPNVKITLCRLIPQFIKTHPDGASLGSQLKANLMELTSDSDVDVKFFAGQAVAAIG